MKSPASTLVAEPGAKNILDLMADPQVWGRTFATGTWTAGMAMVAAILGLPMTPEMLAIFQECTGRLIAPAVAFARAFVIAGRGSGKTLLASCLLTFLAISRNWRSILAPGEVATFALFTPDRRQARVALRYIRALLAASPMLKRMIVAETKESITLDNGAVIEIHTSSFKSSRGYSFGAVIIDEAAFLPTDEAANPDVELVRAVTPGLARVPGSLLLCISSPYARRGVLWENFRKYHGVDGAPVLVWQAPTRRMNPTIAQAVVDDAMAEDPAGASAEWLGQFRGDIEGAFALENITRVIVPGRQDLPPSAAHRYYAMTDAAGGGAGGDAFTLAIGHGERHRDVTDGAGERVVIDCIVEVRPPFRPIETVERLAAVLKTYGCTSVTGDRWAGTWPADLFRRSDIRYVPSERSRSEIYAEFLPLLTAGRIELPDNARLKHQLLGIERRTARGGRDSYDHAPGGHDDIANVTCGVALLAVPGFRRRRAPTGTGVAASVRCADRSHVTQMIYAPDAAALTARTASWRCPHEDLVRDGGVVTAVRCNAPSAIDPAGWMKGEPTDDDYYEQFNAVRVYGL